MNSLISLNSSIELTFDEKPKLNLVQMYMNHFVQKKCIELEIWNSGKERELPITVEIMFKMRVY